MSNDDLIARAEAALKATRDLYNAHGAVSIPEGRYMISRGSICHDQGEVIADLIAALRAEKEARERAEAELAAIRAELNPPAEWPTQLAARAAAYAANMAQFTADMAQATVAAAYRDAAELLTKTQQGFAALAASQNTAMGRDLAAEVARGYQVHIDVTLARTPADASAALDRIRQEAADEALERAAKMIERKAEDYHCEHGVYDYSTDVTEYPGDGAEWMEEREELAAAIRALKGGA